MASIKLQGDTSGEITISAPAVAGTNTLTLPASTGTLATTASPAFTGQATIPTINLTGGQITFPATQSASADANTLDDYEEGTWTPVGTFVTPGTSTSGLAGTYTKIGRQVSIAANGALNKGNASGVFTITGVPFATAFTTAVCFRTAGIGAASTVLQANLEASSGTVIKFLLAPQSTSIAGAAPTAADMNDPDNYIQLFCTYNT